MRFIAILQYEIAKKLYEEIKEKAKNSTIEGFDEFYERFLKTAVNYANNRTDWSFMTKA